MSSQPPSPRFTPSDQFAQSGEFFCMNPEGPERAQETANPFKALTQALLAHLHRGGTWAFIWTPNGGADQDKKLSCWIPVGTPLTPPTAWQSRRNLHFGVNPSSTRREDYQASTNDTIAAINCLYSEFDGKDFTTPTPEEVATYFTALRLDPIKVKIKDEALWKEANNLAKEAKFATNIAGFKALALAHVQKLTPAPSVVVDSGGGYQVYWLLRETFPLRTDEDRENAKDWQARWVARVGGDPGAHDLRRVLRLPGSRNYKPRYAPDYPLVSYVTCDLNHQYDLSELIALLPPPMRAPAHSPEPSYRPSTVSERTAYAGESVIEAYNAAVKITDALASFGYTPSKDRFVRPGGQSASVHIFPDSNTSFHHSSSDPLYSDHARSPFDVLVEYEYASNVKEAVKAAATLLGMEHTSCQETAHDYRPFLIELKLWARTTSFAEFIPPELQGTHYRTDGVDTKVADAVLHLMEKYNRLTVYTTKRTLGREAGVSGDTVLRALTRLQSFLFTVEVSKQKGITITLREEFCIAQLRQKKERYALVAQVRETNEYSPRKATDPFLTGITRQVKDRCAEAVAVAGRTYKEWLATVPKGLGEPCLRVLDALGRCGEMSVQELADETGKTKGAIWRACRRLETEGLIVFTQEHSRAPKVYELTPDVWQQVEQLAPELRTYRLGVERADRYLKESQVWTATQKEAAAVAGEQEQVVALDKRLMRLGNERLKQLTILYADKNLTQAELAQLAFDVQIPVLPHPAVLAKLNRLHETARLDVAEAQRREKWKLTILARTLRTEGVGMKETARILQLADYTPKEAWGAVYRVWPKNGI